MKLALTAIVCVFTLTSNLASYAEDKASSEAVIQIAEKYLDAYSTFKTKNMAPFLADEIIFTDPTSPTSIMFDGKNAVIDGLDSVTKDYKKFTLNYDVERRFESNGVVVFIGQVTYNGMTKNDQSFSATAPIVTAITIKDGKVVMHADYFDYASNAVDMGE